MTKAKAQKARKTRPSLRTSRRGEDPSSAEPQGDETDRKKRSEAPTLPPPKPGDDAVKHSGRVRKGRPSATVDVVTADLSKDRRREE